MKDVFYSYDIFIIWETNSSPYSVTNNSDFKVFSPPVFRNVLILYRNSLVCISKDNHKYDIAALIISFHLNAG